MNVDMKKYNVLFVDDELQVLKAIKRGVHLEEYNKFFANSGKEALEIIKNNNISVVVSDMKMPEMDGIQLLKKVNEIDKDIKKIILSGYASTAQVIASVNITNIDKFILKPWDLETELKPMIREELRKYDENLITKTNVISIEKRNELFIRMIESNKNSFLEIESDFKNVIKLFKMMSSYLYLLTNDMQNELITIVQMKEELNYLESIVIEFINRMPLTKYHFNLKYFKDRLSSFLKTKYSSKYEIANSKISINSEISDYYEFHIKFDYIFMISEIIINNVFRKNLNSKIELEIKTLSDENNIIFIYKINSMESKNSIRNNTNLIILKVFAKMLNGEINFIEKENNLDIITLEIHKRIEE